MNTISEKMKETELCWTIKPVQMAVLPAPGWECVLGKNSVEMQPLVFWIWILRSGDRIGIIDSGLPMGEDLKALDQANQALDEKCVFHVDRTLKQILQDEKIAPEQIDFLLITQTVTYSTGGILREYFPRARVYIAYEGMREFLLEIPGHPPREFYFTQSTWNYLRELLLEKRLVLATESVQVLPGVCYEPTGGHHPGSAAVRVHTDRGVVGILETAFVQENIEKQAPIGIAENAAQCREVIRRYCRECDLVLAGHEPEVQHYLRKFLNQSE